MPLDASIMTHASLLPLGSIESIRPVFWVVMGVFLLLYAWRLAQHSTPWTARLLVGGALLLAAGYSLVLPMYEAGLLERYSAARHHYHGSAELALAWHVVKLVVMNLGWLIFGTGLALHANIPHLPARRQLVAVPSQPVSPAHELAA